MSGPVAAALAHCPDLAGRFATFRTAAHASLDPALVAAVRQAIARVHGCDLDEGAHPGEPNVTEAEKLCLAYAERIPFEHTTITDEEAAAVRAVLGEQRYVAFSVVVALADAECRAVKVGLAELTS